MTTSQNTTTTSRRRRLAAAVLASAIGLGGAASLSGILTSPGPVSRSRDVAIPGVRGTGGGTGYGVSTSPGRNEMALVNGRKAGSPPSEYI